MEARKSVLPSLAAPLSMERLEVVGKTWKWRCQSGEEDKEMERVEVVRKTHT